jgi:hypothetical protein
MCRYYESNPNAFNCEDTNLCLTGLGIGLLAAPAVALAKTVTDIANIGVEVLRQAFRLGTLVHQVSQNLQHVDIHEEASLDPWAYVVLNVTAKQVQQHLDAMYEKQVSRISSFSIVSQVHAL